MSSFFHINNSIKYKANASGVPFILKTIAADII